MVSWGGGLRHFGWCSKKFREIWLVVKILMQSYTKFNAKNDSTIEKNMEKNSKILSKSIENRSKSAIKSIENGSGDHFSSRNGTCNAQVAPERLPDESRHAKIKILWRKLCPKGRFGEPSKIDPKSHF